MSFSKYLGTYNMKKLKTNDKHGNQTVLNHQFLQTASLQPILKIIS